jgi:hypothetical protein
MGRHLSHLMGAVGMIVILGLWLSLLHPAGADRFVNRLAGAQHEYKIVLGASLAATGLTFTAAVRGSRWWYLGVALSSGTLALFTIRLSA